MDVISILIAVVLGVLAVLLVALVWLVIESVKTVKAARASLNDTMVHVDPMLADASEMTKSIKPAVAKIDPLMDRLQLTMDAVNLEMMRVDEILEDLAKITESASSASAAVDNITNAPVKAATKAAARMREKFGSKKASNESAQLGSPDDAMAQAMEDFKAAEEEDALDENVQAEPEAAEEVAPQKSPVDSVPVDRIREKLVGEYGADEDPAK